ncbi:ABC transporter ATP-binding protein (plasmid) [Paroceanicella profunda]|uniref:ABC transporter ATP-binding protein n=1 Tax=Paroceanicella profunda TaxID=2579971 RepID=A0A5B8FJQ7_9RHOB|nr:ABC transporter ATP-binding protein [Paroceanicella profunda]QDL94628.1 ABC transporter ATP-binding protein [Paroceanicella profunda]
MTAPLVDIRGLTLTFGGDSATPVLHGVDLQVARGEILGVIGESGSGKTMTGMALLRLLPGTATVAAEAMTFDGIALPGLDELQFGALRGVRLAMVFQDPVGAFNPSKRVGWHFHHILRRRGETRRAANRARAVSLLGEVGIRRPEETFDLYPHQLSGGMLQRALIALVLALEPDLVVADEPTSNLDKLVEHQILTLFREMQQRLRAGMIFVTHDMAVAAALCDRIAVMRQGVVVETGTAGQIFAAPQHAYTRLLIDTARRLSEGPAKRAQPEPEAGSVPLMRVSGLDVTFPSAGGRGAFRALDGITLDIRRGEVLGLVGESGSGKTTLGRTLLRLLEPSAGSLLYKGRDIAHTPEARLRGIRRELQMVFQDPGGSFNPRKPMHASLADALRATGLRDRAAIASRISGLMQRVGLTDRHAARYPHELSGGQLQRVAIARALALEPELIVADEPVSKLDVSVRAGVLDLFRDIQAETGLAMVFITHDLEVARYLCDRIGVLRHGRLLELGPTGRIFADPQHTYTKTLLATLDYTMSGKHFGAGGYGPDGRA